MTGLDWGIVAFAVLMAILGYQQGFIVGGLSLIGFAIGAFAGSRIGPTLLPDGSESPYAPLTALSGAILVGGIVAVIAEAIAHDVRARVVRGSGAGIADGALGAVLVAAIALGLAWLFGAVALNTPGAKGFREEVQRSAILSELNEIAPPSGSLLNLLNRIDPGEAIRGPDVTVDPPDPAIARDPDVDSAGDSVVKVLGTACGLGVEGSGWVAAPGVVVTNAHVIAGEEDTTVSVRDSSTRLDATPVHYDPSNDLAVLRVGGLERRALKIVPNPKSSTSGAVLGYPENGSFTVSAARVGSTVTAVSQDSYGRGPIQRQITSLRGRVRSGNSGGPLVDPNGAVMTTVFAATRGGPTQGGYGVPNAIVRDALTDTTGEADTGPCT